MDRVMSFAPGPIISICQENSHVQRLEEAAEASLASQVQTGVFVPMEFDRGSKREREKDLFSTPDRRGPPKFPQRSLPIVSVKRSGSLGRPR